VLFLDQFWSNDQIANCDDPSETVAALKFAANARPFDLGCDMARTLSSSQAQVSRPHRIAKWVRSDSFFAYACLLPSLLLMLLIVVVPILNVFFMALAENDSAGRIVALTGIDNFRRLFADPVFPQVMQQTLVWTITMLLVATPLSIALALVLQREFPGRSLARAIVFAPWAVSFVFTAVVWRYILDPYYGHMNLVMQMLLGKEFHASWLGNPATAMPSVIWVGVTLTIPFTTIVTLAGLQSIPVELTEAAKIDGASHWQSFLHVVLPLLQPVLTVATLVNLIYIFNSFPIIWTMTEGGPVNYTDTLVTFLYKRAFRGLDFGMAAAVSVIGFVILTVVSLFYVRATAKDVF
jgi:multiple sugar transport system permease protein